MKKIYEAPEIKAIDVKKDDIITDSEIYMLPEMRASDTNGSDGNE